MKKSLFEIFFNDLKQQTILQLIFLLTCSSLFYRELLKGAISKKCSDSVRIFVLQTISTCFIVYSSPSVDCFIFIAYVCICIYILYQNKTTTHVSFSRFYQSNWKTISGIKGNYLFLSNQVILVFQNRFGRLFINIMLDSNQTLIFL